MSRRFGFHNSKWVPKPPGPGDHDVLREAVEEGRRRVQSAHKACVYEHIGFRFLFDENLTLEGLKQFPVVCLPNTGILTVGRS